MLKALRRARIEVPVLDHHRARCGRRPHRRPRPAAPTTIWSSPSTSTSCSRACARCCAAAPGAARPRCATARSRSIRRSAEVQLPRRGGRALGARIRGARGADARARRGGVARQARGQRVRLGRGSRRATSIEVHLHHLRRKLVPGADPQRARRRLPRRAARLRSIRRDLVLWLTGAVARHRGDIAATYGPRYEQISAHVRRRAARRSRRRCTCARTGSDSRQRAHRAARTSPFGARL